MNLGFDIDGVIADFKTSFLKVVKRRYNRTVAESEIYCHDINLVLGISKQERIELVRETLLSDIAPMSNAAETLRKLASEGHQIFILTARYKDFVDRTRNWLRENGISYTQIIHCNEGEKCYTNVDLDLIVEDNLEEALEWSQRVKNILIYDHPWNQTLNVKSLIKRVYNWDDILDEVQRIDSARVLD